MSALTIQMALVFDGSEYFRHMIKSLLFAFDIPTVRVCETYVEAVKELEDRPYASPFDCILMDWDMEGETELALVRDIRHGNLTGVDKETPIILCTAHTRISQIVDARDAGVSEVILKPIKIDQIIQKLIAARFRKRDFIEAEVYQGPDRRRHRAGFDGDCRRMEEEPLDQEQIDEVMSNRDQGRG